MSDNQFDTVVIGGGPGGYVAAIRAAQLGHKTACIESRGALGGTCLNVGCIPSKALLQSTETYHAAQHKMPSLGVSFKGLSFDLKQIHKHKDGVVSQLTGGVEYLFKKNKVSYIKGHGEIIDPQTIRVKHAEGEQELKVQNIIIATGSEPIELPSAPFDEKDIVSSTGALDFSPVPKKLVVIGGGVIGLELGSVWSRLGAEVTVIEAAPTILSMMDGDVVKVMRKTLKGQGLSFHEGTFFESVKKVGKKLQVTCTKDGETIELSCDKLLVAVGRRAFTKGLGLENIGLQTEKNGKIPVNDHFQTAIPNIYAIGDVIDGPMLAHKAEDEGVACAELIAGKPGHVNYRAIPNVVYTSPEVAAVGLTEEEAKAQGYEVRVGKCPFSANGRAKAMAEPEGFVKLIADKNTDLLLGAHIVGAHASELIAELALAFEYSASAEDVARSVHAHPTMAEAIKEAALSVDKRSINF